MSQPLFRMRGSRRADWEVLIEDPQGLAQLIGDDVLAAFYKCLLALDRVSATEHLIFLVHEHSERSGLPRTAPSIARDYYVLMLNLAGTLYELTGALQCLSSTRAHMRLADRSSWVPLEEMRKRWSNDPTASTLRNGFANHLGDIEKIKVGIAKSPPVVVLHHGSGMSRGNDRFIAPLDALLAGEGVEDVPLMAFLQKMSGDHLQLRERLFAYFEAVSRHHGVDYVDESTE